MVIRTKGKRTNQQRALRIQEQARLYSLIPGYLSYSRVFPYNCYISLLAKFLSTFFLPLNLNLFSHKLARGTLC